MASFFPWVFNELTKTSMGEGTLVLTGGGVEEEELVSAAWMV